MLSKALQGAAKGVAVDSDFENVTLLLHGNGTNGAQNNTFIDGSSNAFSITRNGNTTQGTFSPYGDNWSNYFDGGANTALTASSTTAFDFGTGDFTVECWAYVTAQTGSFTLLCATEGVNQYWGFGDLGAGLQGMSMYAGSSGTDIYSGSSNIPALNRWNHLVWQRSSGVASMYLNGTRVYNASYTVNFGSSATGFRIGQSNNYANYYTTGYISNLRVVKGSAVYSGATITVPTAPLTAITNTSLLTCQSNRFIDNSTNAFTITRNGNVSVQRFSPFSPTAAYASGTIGGSGYFDGTGDYLTLSGNTNLALGSGNFTIELWVNITSFTTYGTFATTYNNTPVAGTWFLRLNASTQQWQWQNGSDGGAPNFKAYNSSTNLIAGAWHHLAVVRSSGVVTLYQDGVNVGGGTDVETLVAPTFWIGQTINGYPMNGYISNLRVLKGTAQYTAAFTPPTAPLTAITNTQLLTNFTNAGIIDNAMMNDLETVGNAQISTTQSKFGGSSMYFDGSGDGVTAPSNNIHQFGTGDFTIEFWVYINSFASNRVLFDIANGNVLQLYTNTSGVLVYYTPSTDRITSSALSTSTWYHVALARSGTSTKLFVNGTQAGSTYTDSTNYSAGGIGVGSRFDATIPLNGYIDDLRITKGVARYTANFTAPTAPFADQ